MELRPVAQSPLNLNTAYKYHCIRKYPALIFKVAGKLFVDMDEWKKMAVEARDRQIEKAKNVRG